MKDYNEDFDIGADFFGSDIEDSDVVEKDGVSEESIDSDVGEDFDIGADFFGESDVVDKDAEIFNPDLVGDADEVVEVADVVSDEGTAVENKGTKKSSFDSDVKKSKKGKESKTKKPKKVKPKEPKKVKSNGPKVKKPFNKKLLGIGIGVLVVVIGLVVFNIVRDKNNYYSGWSKITKNECGSFRYVIDVRTEQADKDKKNEISEKALDALSSVGEDAKNSDVASNGSLNADNASGSASEGSEDNSGSESGTESTKFTDWSTKDGIVTTDWSYPNYQIVIDGETLSTDPVESKYTVSLSTEAYSGVLCEFISSGGKLYVNVEKLQSWLVNSKDEYFVKLASNLPESSKYMVVDENSLEVLSGYSEDDEKDSGFITTKYRSMLLKYKVLLGSIFSTIESASGGKGLSKSSGMYYLSLSGKDAERTFSNIKNTIKNRDVFYDNYVDLLSKDGVIDEDNKKQMYAEKDNFISGTEGLYRVFTTSEFNDIQIGGKTSIYDEASGYKSIESSFITAFTSWDRTYTISLSGRLVGKGEDITVPEVSPMEIDQNQLWGTLRNVADYLTGDIVLLTKQLNPSVSTIQSGVLSSFAKYINNNSESKINELTAMDFLRKYQNFSPTDDSTDKDKKNAELVQNFMTLMTELSGGSVVQPSGVQQDNQFGTVNKDIQRDVKAVISWNKAESHDTLGVVDITLVNNSKKDVKINLQDFNLQTIVGSRYPANSETLLKGYDSGITDIKSTVKVKAGQSLDLSGGLKFLCSNGVEYMDIYYQGVSLGTLVLRK